VVLDEMLVTLRVDTCSFRLALLCYDAIFGTFDAFYFLLRAPSRLWAKGYEIIWNCIGLVENLVGFMGSCLQWPPLAKGQEGRAVRHYFCHLYNNPI